MGSDKVSEKGLIKGNAVSLSLNDSFKKEIKMCNTKLSNDGTQDHPLENNFWAALFYNLKDKFGNQWLLHFN